MIHQRIQTACELLNVALMRLPVVALLLTSTSCGGGGQPDSAARDFLESVRANDFAEAYTDDQVTGMFEQMCTVIDSGADPEQILDNYSALSAMERTEMADIATGTCE